MLALLPLALALVPQAPADPTLAPDAETRWVAFELTQYNQIRFPLDFGGRPARAVLDTGLSDTVVTSAFAEQMGLVPGQTRAAVAIGGDVPVSWAQAAPIRFGGLSRSGGRVGVIRAEGQARFGADILIGSDILACCALDIDFDAKRFRILPSGRLPFTGTIGRLAHGLGAGLYVTSIGVAGKRLAPIIVDTGDGASLTLRNRAWAAIGYQGPRTTTLGWGVGGESVTETAIVPGVSLAGAAPVESEVRVEPPRAFLDRIGAAGRIGASLLMRYRVLLDPKAGRIVLRPGAQAAAPVPRSTSGLLLAFRRGALDVLHVMRGSPAAAAGLRQGDRICFADGAAIAEQIDAQGLLDWTTGVPGRTVRLELCDGAERTLTLRRFY